MSAPLKRITQWSYSTYKSYKQCPLKVKLSKIDKIRDPGSAATQRGEEIHLQAELFIKESQKALPDSLKLFRSQFKKLAKLGSEVKPEEEWAVDRSWKPCEYRSHHAWLRAKIDAHYIQGSTLTIIDYKTGKVYDDNKAQVALYALMGLLRFPVVKRVNVELWYLDQGVEVKDSYTVEEVGDMKAQWEHAVANMLVDTEFAPRPSYLCKFCFYSKNKSGNCEY